MRIVLLGDSHLARIKRELGSPVADSASARLFDSRACVRPLGSRAFDRDGVHLSGEGYRLLLPALAEAVSL